MSLCYITLQSSEGFRQNVKHTVLLKQISKPRSVKEYHRLKLKTYVSVGFGRTSDTAFRVNNNSKSTTTEVIAKIEDRRCERLKKKNVDLILSFK